MSSIIQIFTVIIRLISYSYAVFVINKENHGADLLVFLGYLPFLALTDELVKAYSRSVYLNGLNHPKYIDNCRNIYASMGLSFIVLGLLIAFTFSCQWLLPIILIVAYVEGGLCLMWEQWMSRNSRPLKMALIEATLLLLILCIYASTEEYAYLLVLSFMTFPLSRLIILISPRFDEDIKKIKKKGITQGLISYTLFAAGQQVIGAVTAALPSIYAQITGDYSSLARNLISFRIILSAAGAGSLFINAMASRIFYGTADKIFYGFEEAFINKSRTILVVIALVGFLSSITFFIFPNNIYAIGLIVFILGVLNFESSLLMNCGLPRQAFTTQLIVFIISLSTIFILNHKILPGSFLMIFFVLFINPIGVAIFKAHKIRLNERKIKIVKS